jgi:hypothetical protein
MDQEVTPRLIQSSALCYRTDIQCNYKYFKSILITFKLIVLKLAEKNYFCGGKFRS